MRKVYSCMWELGTIVWYDERSRTARDTLCCLRSVIISYLYFSLFCHILVDKSRFSGTNCIDVGLLN